MRNQPPALILPPSARPGLLTPSRRLPVLVATHLGFLIWAAACILWWSPSATIPVLLLMTTGIVAELAPASWRRRWFGEILFALVATASFLMTWQAAGRLDHPRLWAWLHMAAAYWVLIPVRSGLLRMVAVLCAIAVLIPAQASLAAMPGPLASLLAAAWPGHSSPQWLQHGRLDLVLTSLAALAADTHLRTTCGLNQQAQVSACRPTAWWRFALWPVTLCLAGSALMLGPVRQVVARQAWVPVAWVQPTTRAVDVPHIRIGDRLWVASDPLVHASLIGQGRLEPRRYYLRALTLPRLTVNPGGQVSWERSQDRVLVFNQPDRMTFFDGPDGPMATVLREPGWGDVVLRPDQGRRLELPGCGIDSDGNCFQTGLGTQQTSYAADLGGDDRPHDPTDLALRTQALVIDDEVAFDLRRRIPITEQWRMSGPAEAAEAITGWLARRCRYATSDLPPSTPGPIGVLHPFLFADEPKRIGHCQYFAGAAVLLLRACGHPARIVVGYTSPEVVPSREGDHDLVHFRGLDAHAWVEVLVPSAGRERWRRFDPTPPAAIDERRRTADLTAPDDPDRPPAASGIASAKTAASSSPWLPGLLGLAILLAAVLALLLHRRRDRATTDSIDPRLRQTTDDLIAVALSAGIPIHPHTTIPTLVQDLARRTGLDLAPSLARHQAARFGRRTDIPDWPLAEIRAHLRDPARRPMTDQEMR